MKLRTILDYIYPPRCPLCEGIHRGICKECKKQLVYIRDEFCLQCGRPLAQERTEFCPDCKKRRHSFDQGRALLSYQGAVRKSLYRLKYANRKEYAAVYAEEMAVFFCRWIVQKKISCIVPIPLHASRRKSRGYNQAALLAKAMAEQLGIPYEGRLLFRRKKTAPLKLLNGVQRREMLKDAFCVKGEVYAGEVILLMDDIYTTGSTADAAAAALKQAGAGAVYVLSVATGG